MEDKEQFDAISCDLGPALILAGPGSGKTYTLTHHVKHLIENGVPPKKIVVITFTKQAASEMLARFNSLLPSSAGKVFFGTFHSFFYRMNFRFSKKNPEIIDNTKRYEILYSIVKDEKLYDEVSVLMSKYKARLNRRDLIFDYDGQKEYFFYIYSQYQKELHSLGLCDFDDILVDFYENIASDKSFLSMLQSEFTHCLIDEFQDINEIQYETIKLLFNHTNNIYAVGDEDQSIYGFRGADGKIMKRFKDEYNAKVIELKTNYRSYASIIEPAHKLISNNQMRLRESKQTCVNADIKNRVHLNVFEDEIDEINALISDIQSNMSISNSVAVLFRSNAEVESFKEKIKKKDNTNAIFIEVLKDLLKYINYFLNGGLSLPDILNIPQRNIPVNIVKSDLKNLESIYKNIKNNMIKEKLFVLMNQLNVMKKLHPFAFTTYFSNVLGHRKYIIEKYMIKNFENVDGIYNSIYDLAKKSDSLIELKDRVIKKISALSLNTGIKDKNITVLTFHKSKGLEFDAVFIPDIIEGNIPSIFSYYSCSVEEERRLFYVAMTRARKELYLYTIKNEENGGTFPSRFLKEII